MENPTQLYESYLTDHFSHVSTPRFRERKKTYMRYGYEHLFPKDKSARILDIGPGYGELLEILIQEQHYTDVKAVDLSKEVGEYCNKLFPGSTVIVDDTVDYLTQNSGKFDCIFMFHILEHVPKNVIIPFLQAVYHALAPNGKVVIEVPNMGNPLTGLNIRYADFTHEIGFTEMSMQFVLQTVGFRETVFFENKLSPDRWSRPIQFALQKITKFGIFLLYRAWGMHAPKVLSPALCVYAMK